MRQLSVRHLMSNLPLPDFMHHAWCSHPVSSAQGQQLEHTSPDLPRQGRSSTAVWVFSKRRDGGKSPRRHFRARAAMGVGKHIQAKVWLELAQPPDCNVTHVNSSPQNPLVCTLGRRADLAPALSSSWTAQPRRVSPCHLESHGFHLLTPRAIAEARNRTQFFF